MLARRVVLKEKFLQRFTLGGRFLNTTQTRAEQIEKKEAERTDKLFKYVAPVYDHLNDAAYLGFHRNWRNKFIRHVAPSENTKLIDVAGGTGAIPIRFLDYVKKNNIPNCHVTVCDINEDMLKMGKRKSVNYDPDLITWIVADGQSLPFEDETFNAYTISFGLRCCSNMDKMLNEAFRILQPGGKFFCLEFSTPDNKIARWCYGLHSSYYIPMIGRLTKQRDILKYLVESIARFPDQENLKEMIERVGFQQVKYENIYFGLVAIHSGIKP